MPKLLILSSNPRKDLNLDREVSDLVTVIQRVGTFEIGLGLGCRPDDLIQLFTEHRPQIVHFCGHGAAEQGLVFQDESGRETFVSTEVISRLFETFAREVHCAVLNACDSEQQAIAIVQHIDYVVGMSQPILDKAAYYFATGFYQGLANGNSIEQSYQLGCLAIQIWSETQQQSNPMTYRKFEPVGAIAHSQSITLPEHLKPVLHKRPASSSSSPNLALQDSDGNLIVNPLHPSSSFVRAIQQEVDRKAYKDQARSAYDNFGQSAIATTTLTKAQYTQRHIVVNKVKAFWIDGFLKPSLQGDVLRLGLEARPDAIANLTQGIEALAVELDQSFETLRDTKIYGEMGQGRTLLILGQPGSGKTIALLQLAQRLIERSEQNLSLSMPMVFNLSSWTKDRKAIVDWLMDELREKYQVPKVLSEPWIAQQQLILLLDGLDEVSAEYRNDCVRALNKFMGLFPHTEVAICSRVKDYENLTERLQISSALYLQPLSPQQIEQFLDRVGGTLTGLKAVLKHDPTLEQFAQTPLILNLMSVAYQGWSAAQLRQELGEGCDRKHHLFNTYIDLCLDRGATSDYPKPQVLHWLSWLADQMSRERQIIFLIEKLQPTWLNHDREKKIYQVQSYIGALVGGLAGGLLFGAIFSTLIGGLRIQPQSLILISGLNGALINLLMLLPTNEILPVERINWSRQRARLRVMREFLTGLGYGLIGGSVLGLSFGIFSTLRGDLQNGLSQGLHLGQTFGLSGGLSIGLLFALGSGLGSTEIVQRAVPNQGIQNSLRNSLVIGLGAGLMGGLIGGIIGWLVLGQIYGAIGGLTRGLILGLIGGPFAALKYGGSACIQHFSLRYMLHQKGRIPWNYARFLDFASARLLMKKVGGGYVFFHRMLLEHFARMYQASPK